MTPTGEEKQEFLKGTLDMLILKIVALGPIHGYAIALRVEQISKDVFQLQQGSLYPALHKLEKQKLLSAEWKQTDTGREQSSIRWRPRDGSGCRLKCRIGNDCQERCL